MPPLSVVGRLLAVLASLQPRMYVQMCSLLMNRVFSNVVGITLVQGGEVEPAGLPCKAGTTERPPLIAAS
jgi:hypothetical protein